MRGADLEAKQLRDDLMTMLIAGHETTAAVLTWTLFCLAQAPGAEAKVLAEVDSVVGDRVPSEWLAAGGLQWRPACSVCVAGAGAGRG